MTLRRELKVKVVRQGQCCENIYAKPTRVSTAASSEY